MSNNSDASVPPTRKLAGSNDDLHWGRFPPDATITGHRAATFQATADAAAFLTQDKRTAIYVRDGMREKTRNGKEDSQWTVRPASNLSMCS